MVAKDSIARSQCQLFSFMFNDIVLGLKVSKITWL